MSKKAARPQTPRHILIWDEDWEYLETRFGQAGLHPIGVSKVLRALIHQRVLEWREAENRAANEILRARLEEENDGDTSNLDSTAGSTPRVNI